ncbi:LamG domain-containing protein [Bacteroides salyersiae]|nr:LamG domain-containing protein [Bacteroides salyersiae]
MKKNTFILYAILALCIPRISAQAEQDLEVWYKFDYQQGDNQIKDYSGNDRHMITKKYYGGTGELSNFQWGTDADHAYVYFAPDRDADLVLTLENENWKGILASQPRTLATWVKVDQNVDPNSGQWLYSYGDETATGGGYRIELKGTSIEFANAINTGANQWCNRSVCWMTSYPQATWHHLAFVYDGTGDRKTGMKLYIDGKEENLNPVSDEADFSINTTGLYSPEIGRYMKGISLSDFRFYSRALTADEISSLITGNQDFTIESLNTIIQKAITEKKNKVTIPPGTYRGKAPFLNIKASDLEIIADGVTMVCETKVRALNFDQCKNITLRGLTIDYNPLTFTQGEIVEVGSGYVDVKIHAGYPVEAYSRIDILDPKTRYRKRGSKFIWGATAENKGNGIIRVFQSGDMTNVAHVGDLATMSTGRKEHTVRHTA